VRPLTLDSLALLATSICCAIVGQLMLKSAMTQVGRVGYAEVAAPLDTVARALREPRMWIGLTLFAISAAFWLVVLSRLPLSVAYPALGVSYVVVVLLSRLVLHEHVPLLRWIGVLVVALGIALIGVSFRVTEQNTRRADIVESSSDSPERLGVHAP
jgi:multidrug transporter EmrE-like cation transporter